MFNRKEYMKQWKEKNPEYMNEYRIANKEKIEKQVKICYEKWCKKNPEYNHQYYIDHKGKYINTGWAKNHPERMRELKGKWKKNKSKTDIKYIINNRISNAISLSLKGNKNGRHWETLVGYTLNDLIKRLKITISKGYTWQDFLKGKLHIDHIIPIRAFVFKKPEDEEFKQCWSLWNLRLLTRKENLSKHDSITNPILLGLLKKGR